MNKNKNLWILTEERPKKEVLGMIFQKFAKDFGITCFINNIRILPILNEDRTFSFTYEVRGLDSQKVNKVFIKTVSGYSSFVDFMIFYQADLPTQEDIPIYAIEETKTDDKESRNTGVGQRALKFPYVENYYPEVKKIMLYSLQIEENDTVTDTNIFGNRCLLTQNIEILGKKIDKEVMKPFLSVDELVDAKNAMRMAPKGNVSIRIIKTENKIKISGRLFKTKGLSHDPNIGTLTMISSALRQLGWEGIIEITQHGLNQSHITKKNKFIRIAKIHNITLEGLRLPEEVTKVNYWKYDVTGEKLGTIFIHLVVENFTEGLSIYENHAGCERGYFMTSTGDPITVSKYKDKEKYKAGDKTQIICIPDLVLADVKRLKIINIEGKKDTTMELGIKQLNDFDAFEETYIQKYYPEYKEIIRTVVIYGGEEKSIKEIDVSFLLNKNGEMILNVNKSPELFQEAIKNMIDYWEK
uniref:hypothetical protein n=1 Tax=Candidatus Thiodubiliella endoseptemdiera TaxID=2738886 RepID=UPI0034DF4004